MGHFSKGEIPPVAKSATDAAATKSSKKSSKKSSSGSSVDSSSTPPTPVVNEVEGYIFGSLLGDGNNATVRSCHHVDQPNIQLAVKVIAKGRITTLSAFNRVVAEVKGLRKLWQGTSLSIGMKATTNNGECGRPSAIYYVRVQP